MATRNLTMVVDRKHAEKSELGFAENPTVFSDKSFTFETKSTPASILLKKAAGLEKGSGVPHIEKVGKVNREQLENIVRTKEGDLTAGDLDAAVRTIAGTARSMGIEVEGV